MCSLIGLGHWSQYYYYILISFISRFLKEDILGLGVDNQIIIDLKIESHPIITLLIGYISDCLLSLLLWFFFYHREKKQEQEKFFKDIESQQDLSRLSTPDKAFELKDSLSKKETFNDNEFLPKNYSISTMKYYLIHNDLSSDVDVVSKASFIFIIISSCFIVFKECLIKILYASNDIFDYYFLNLIIIAIIYRCFYKKKIYKHHKLAIILVAVVSGSCLISCILVINNDNFEGKYINILYTNKDSIYIIFILISIYIAISICFCIGIIFQKNIMQSKFISSYKFLFYKGAFGILITIIALIITTNIQCPNEAPPFGPPDGGPPEHFGPGNRNNSNITEQAFQLFRCRDHYLNETFFDNFFSYFNFSEYEDPNRYYNTTAEIFILIGYFILNFISNLSIILVNKFLTPFHYLITESFYSLIHIPYQFITRSSFEETMEQFEKEYKETDKDKLYKLIFLKDGPMILKFVAAIFEFLGYMIYMEIIQLNFCGLNRDISKNIKKRAKLDAILSEQDLNDDNDRNPMNDSLEASRGY